MSHITTINNLTNGKERIFSKPGVIVTCRRAGNMIEVDCPLPDDIVISYVDYRPRSKYHLLIAEYDGRLLNAAEMSEMIKLEEFQHLDPSIDSTVVGGMDGILARRIVPLEDYNREMEIEGA